MVNIHKRVLVNGVHAGKMKLQLSWWLLLVIVMLLIVSGIEVNPDPASALQLRCCVCNPPVSFISVKAYIVHCQLHSNVPNFWFRCCVVGCIAEFRNATALRMHIARSHSEIGQRVKQIYKNSISFRCSQALCQQIVAGQRDFVDHLRAHIDDGLKLTCPFAKCTKKIDSKSRFSVHLNRMHRNWSYISVQKIMQS